LDLKKVSWIIIQETERKLLKIGPSKRAVHSVSHAVLDPSLPKFIWYISGNADISMGMKKLQKPAKSADKREPSSPTLKNGTSKLTKLPSAGKARKTTSNVLEETASGQERLPFPIVGIGASAGGLEALEQFLRQVPLGCGMAFVIIQHLDPTHKGIMPELLQRTTNMEVFQVNDRMEVQPDCVYVIPPNTDMSILHGVLHLFEPAAPRGLRLPIDFFFRSLAEDRQERSIGVILSGMGSDGTLGLRAIKEKAGAAFVQGLDSA